MREELKQAIIKKATSAPLNIAGELVVVPGSGTYRLARRREKDLQNKNGDSPHFISQALGPGTSLMTTSGAAAGIGAGLGALLGDKGYKSRMAGVGAGLGALSGGALWLLAELASPIRAAATKRRTKKEQEAYANSGTLKEYLVPGVASYNAWKTLGRALESDAAIERDEKA